MVLRVALAAAALAAVALLIWHPAHPQPVPVIVATAAPLSQGGATAGRRSHSRSHDPSGDDLVVYVAGAVKRPGLYAMHGGDRDARAVRLAGGFLPTADAGGVNLAQRAADGDEIFVPATGESRHGHSSVRRGRRHARTPPNSSVSVNDAEAAELAVVPGIGQAIAQRIVELRRREGAFTSLDQLLDVAGMTQTRLDRARPYLRDP